MEKDYNWSAAVSFSLFSHPELLLERWLLEIFPTQADSQLLVGHTYDPTGAVLSRKVHGSC